MLLLSSVDYAMDVDTPGVEAPPTTEQKRGRVKRRLDLTQMKSWNKEVGMCVVVQ